VNNECNQTKKFLSRILKCITKICLYIPVLLYYKYLKKSLINETQEAERYDLKGVVNTITESEYSVLHHQPLLPLTHQNHYDVATKNLFQKTFGCLKEYSDMVSGGSRVQLINDNSLISRIKYTSLSHGLIKTETGDWVFKFPFIKPSIRPDFYYDVKELYLKKNGKIEIVDYQGSVFTPDSTCWNLAKAHVQSQLTLYGALILHARHHNSLLATFVNQAQSILSSDSILRDLLNMKQTDKSQRCIFFSSDKRKEKHSKLSRSPWLLNVASSTSLLKFFGPDVTFYTKLNNQLNFHYFLLEYYKVTEDYVKGLLPFIEKDFEILRSSLPREQFLLTKSCVDVVTELLFQLYILQSADNFSFVEGFAKQYGCFGIRKPLLGFTSKQNCVIDLNENDEWITSSKMGLFNPYDIYSCRCFLRVHTCYWDPHKKQQNSKLLIKLDTTNNEVIQLTYKFHENCNTTTRILQQRGEDFVPLYQLGATTCY